MSAFGNRLTEAQLAFVLLTRLPVGRLPDPAPKTAASAWAFPLVGAVVGIGTGLVYLATASLLPNLAAALLGIATGVVATGALHEDGLADVADGFGGGATRDRKLEIMRDSRIGSYGVVALILALGLTASAISVAPSSGQTLWLFATIGAVSRAVMLLPMALLPPARSDGLGQGAALAPGWRLWTGLAIGAAFGLATSLPVLLIALLAAAVMLGLAKRQIGGQTGDVLGATQKISECVCWLVAAAQISAS